MTPETQQKTTTRTNRGSINLHIIIISIITTTTRLLQLDFWRKMLLAENILYTAYIFLLFVRKIL